MSDEQREKRGSGFLAVAAAVLLLISYPLSLGPAILLHRNLTDPTIQRPIELFYVPLQWLHENTFLQAPLDWYVDLWE